MNESCGNAKREETLFETILRELDEAVATAQSQSDTYGALVGRMNEYSLSCDEPMKCASSNGPSCEPITVVYKLQGLTARLRSANRKNGEIITNLKILV